MSPEATQFVRKAREDLDEARQVAAIGLARLAARCAYFAVFHAAEAVIVERTGKVAKSHTGVRTEFARQVRHDPKTARTMTSFLAQAYKYKEIGDYGVGVGETITADEARLAIASAANFIDWVAEILN